MINWITSRIRGEKKKERVKIEVEELKKALIEDPKFRDEILRELEYRTGRRDLLKAGVLGLLGLAVGGAAGAGGAAVGNETVIETISDYTGVKIPKPCTCIVAQDGTGDYDVLPNEDASEVIQEAIDYAYKKGGGKVKIREGAYQISRTLYLKNGVSVVGEGACYNLWSEKCRGTILMKEDNSGAVIQDGEFLQRVELEKIGIVSKKGTAILLNNKYYLHVIIRDCEIYSMNGIHADELERSFELLIFNNRLTSRGGNIGIYLGPKNSDNMICNNIIRGYEIGILLDGSSCTVINNHIYKHPTPSIRYGIRVNRGGCIILSNYIEGKPSIAGIEIKSSREIISNNVIWVKRGADCIILDRNTSGWLSHITITNNIMSGEDEKNYALNAIKLGNNVTNLWEVNIKDNIAFACQNFKQTENSGTAIIKAGQSSVVVNHNLIHKPSKVLVTPTDNIGSVWVTNVTASQFTINCSVTPNKDVQINWYAKV